MDKNELRKIYREKRANISEEERNSISEKIMKRIIELEYYKKSDCIFTYVDTSEEIITRKLIKKAWEDKKKVAVPVMTGEKHTMIFIEINDFNELYKNKYGIEEPEIKEEKILKATGKEKVLFIVPGLVFGKNMYRIGYGGGFYDKYIDENKIYKSIGVAMQMQIRDSVPYDELDRKIDMIITENEIIKGE